MKTRESGMPEESLWTTFFQAEESLDRLWLRPGVGNVVEFGCGYGTFTIPAARRSLGMVYTFDIDPEMVATTRAKVKAEPLTNVQAFVRDFVADGTGLSNDSAAYAMLFNILHAEHPQGLLAEAFRVLVPGGTLGIMHWNYDPTTPRGPSMNIRPRAEQCQRWAAVAGFECELPGVIDLPPHHYGLIMRKPMPTP